MNIFNELENYSYKGSLGQRGTKYALIEIKKAGDIEQMDNKIKSILSR